MTSLLKKAVFLSFMMLLVACQREVNKEIILLDFESDAELDNLDWHCHALFSLSNDFRTHGTKSLKMELYPSIVPVGVDAVLIINDWRDYNLLSLDVFNPSNSPFSITVRIDDRDFFLEDGDWYSERFELRYGVNHLIIPFDSFITKKHRRLDLSHIHELAIFVENLRTKKILYLDTIKIQKSGSS